MIDLSQRLADTDAGTLKEMLHQLRSIPAVADDAKLSDVFGFVEPSAVVAAQPTRDEVSVVAVKDTKAKSPKV